jgi:hypothetical protein
MFLSSTRDKIVNILLLFLQLSRVFWYARKLTVGSRALFYIWTKPKEEVTHGERTESPLPVAFCWHGSVMGIPECTQGGALSWPPSPKAGCGLCCELGLYAQFSHGLYV